MSKPYYDTTMSGVRRKGCGLDCNFWALISEGINASTMAAIGIAGYTYSMVTLQEQLYEFRLLDAIIRDEPNKQMCYVYLVLKV